MPAHADDQQRDRLATLNGLYQRDPRSALMISVAMLSLAGLPPFPGFVAKFLIFRNVMAAGYTAYAIAGLIGSYVGIYFYLRVIQVMFMGASAPESPSASTESGSRTAAVLCLVATVVVAIVPGWLMGRL